MQSGSATGLSIYWNDNLCDSAALKSALQKQANRLQVGQQRYGKENARKKYFSRARKEMAAYEKTRNMEHLFNAANYCLLESIAPQYDAAFHDPTVDSVTRKSTK